MTSLSASLLPRDRSATLPAWARLIGVTRVARVTGLDRLGVEVACAIRPTGQVLQVSNGKGRSFEAAKASALSEALELWVCEHPRPEDFHWRGSFERPWARAQRLDGGEDVFIPASQVWCPAGPISVGVRDTPWTANGLGAHPDPEHALWHGLMELLEREALCQLFPDGWTPEHLRRRALRFEHGLNQIVHCVDTTPRGWPIPVVAVLIADGDTRAPALAAGYACRRTPAEAAEAAFLEACQSRLTEIHGAREDVVQVRHHIPEWVAAASKPKRDLNSLPRWKGSLPGLLRKMGIAAAAVDLSRPEIPISVARVFVPGFRISDLLL